MGRVTALNWGLLEEWSPMAFGIGGGLFLVSPVTKGLTLFTDLSPPMWLVTLFVFPGLLVSLVGLLGMYPQLSNETPRLALAGGAVAVVAGGGVTLLFGWVLASIASPIVRGLTITPAPGVLFLVVMALISTGYVLFGAGSLRSDVFSGFTGFLLLMFAIPWMVILAVTPVYGADLPRWLALAVYSMMPIVLLSAGYSVRGETIRAHPDTPPNYLPTG